jgi:tetratricopeptide (TPR) repeat protein
MRSLRLICLLTFLLLPIFFLPWNLLVGSFRMNMAELDLLRNLAHKRDALSAQETELSNLSLTNCHAYWLLGIIFDKAGKVPLRDSTRQSAIRCSPSYISLAMVVAPENINLAIQSTKIYPEHAEAWFWLAGLYIKDNPEQAVLFYWKGLQEDPNNRPAWQGLEDALAELDTTTALQIYKEFGLDDLANISRTNNFEAIFILARVLSKDSPEKAIKLYRQGLQISPGDGVRWRELGDILRPNDPEGAIDAYLHSCYYFDPGFNGCYRAGLTAEQMGDYQNAIRYYRRSQWSGSIENAIRLEKMLTPQPTP